MTASPGRSPPVAARRAAPRHTAANRLAPFVAAAVLLSGSPALAAGTSSAAQGLDASIETSIAWGSAGGCVENLGTQDFGALTPAAGTSVLGPFGALPAGQASINAQGDSVWVGCLTTNGVLSSVTAQPTSPLTDAHGDQLPLADVAIGTTNNPAGGKCEITANQTGPGGCGLGANPVTLLSTAGGGTSEIDWQYQLTLPAGQAPGDYTGGLVTLTATAAAGAPQPPVNQTPPSIAPAAPQVGIAETADPGTWTQSPTGYQYQWQDCNGPTCTAITGATGQTYTPTSSDAGATLDVVVTATNSAGSASATSAQSSAVTQAPANSDPPSLSTNSPTVGSPISVSNGSWSGYPAPTLTYQWSDCSGQACTPISGATSATYTPVAADAGDTLQAAVTATNTLGVLTVTAGPTAAAVTQAPADSIAPSLSTTSPAAGVPITVSPGTWTGVPAPTYSYQWIHCAGGVCTPISGATSATYTPVAADAGDTLKATVTGANSAGQASATTDPTQPVTAGPPVNQTLPVISPTSPQQGQPVTTTTGTWSTAATFTYQWERCSGTCSPISGATSVTYTPTTADVGTTLEVTVTATNASGAAQATSAPTAAVAPSAGTIQEFSDSDTFASNNDLITAGPGGAVWVANSQQQEIQEITSSGSITNFTAGGTPNGITEGSDGNLWFTTPQTSPAIWRMTTGHVLNKWSLTGCPSDIVPGPDGNLWVARTCQFGVTKVTTQGVTTTYNNSSSGTQYLAVGANGELWYTEEGSPDIGQVSTSGTYSPTPIAIPAPADGIPEGSDGNIWVTLSSSQVARITTSGTVTTYPVPSVGDGAIAPGPDGSLWFAESTGAVGRITTSGSVSQFWIPSGQTPISLTAGPDGDLWFVTTHSVGRLATPNSSSTPIATVRPTLSTSTPAAGQPVSVTGTGSWTNGPTTFSYQWYSCTAAVTCAPISGATTASYTPTAAQSGDLLQVAVTASNTSGSGQTTSSQTAAVS